MLRVAKRWGLLASLLCAILVVAATAAGWAQPSPHVFLERVYKPYLTKEASGIRLSNEFEVRRFFASPLADAILKDLAEAKKANEVPLLNGDPFLDAQDWELSDLKIVVKGTGKTAVGTVTFIIFKEPRTVTLDLVNTETGWRIADIRSPSGSLRALYKLK